MSLLEVKCPLCKGTLWIEIATGKVVDHKSADHQKQDFDTFLKTRQKPDDFWDEKLKKAKDDTAKRKAEMEERFKQAKEHPEELQGDVESPFKWD
jgi:hypothetical protein